MSLRAIAWAWDQVTRTPTEKLALLCLADFHNDRSGRCDPSFQTLANRCQTSRRNMMRIIESLESQRLIVKGKRGGTSSEYDLSIDPSGDVGVTPECPLTGDTRVTSGAPARASTGDAHDTSASGSGDTHVTSKPATSDTGVTPECPLTGDTHVTTRSGTGDTHVTPLVTPTSPTGDTSVTQTGRTGIEPEEKTPQPPVARSGATLDLLPMLSEIVEPTFDEFWQAYPVKHAKPEAAKKFARLPIATKRLVIDHVRQRALDDPQWLRGFIPHPTTFLNQQRWTDEYQTAPRQQAGYTNAMDEYFESLRNA